VTTAGATLPLRISVEHKLDRCRPTSKEAGFFSLKPVTVTDITEQPHARAQARQCAFLKAFALTANVSGAARAAKIGRTQVYAWQEHDETFALEMQQAREEAYDRLEQEALRRAVEGVRRERPVFSRGEQVGTEVITEYSDQLLILLLKAARPSRFRDNARVEHTGADGGPIRVQEDRFASLSDDELRRLADRS
jgi:hypothetical protein